MAVLSTYSRFLKNRNYTFSLILILVKLFLGFRTVNCVSYTDSFFKKTEGKRFQNTFKTNLVSSKVKCCLNCHRTVDCKSVNYDEASKECELSEEPYVAVSVHGQADIAYSVYSKKDWMLVFRGTAGAGGDVYTAWMNGISVTTDDVTCITTDVTSCNQHYRNPVIDSWTSIEMAQVKFAFYKNNAEAAYIIFNATGSNITNWFTKSRVIQSSWTNLKFDTFNYYSIIGHEPGRRFLINRNYGGCTADTAYSIIVTEQGHYCNYDYQLDYPQFLYANSATYGTPHSMSGFDRADVMAIFIK